MSCERVTPAAAAFSSSSVRSSDVSRMRNAAEARSLVLRAGHGTVEMSTYFFGCSLTRVTSWVGLTKRSAMSSQISVVTI